MQIISLYMDGRGCWPDIDPLTVRGGEVISAARIDGGMDDGSPAVALRMQMDDGTTTIAQISLLLLKQMAKCMDEGKIVGEVIVNGQS